MCSTSKINAALKGVSSGGSSLASTVPSISAQRVRQNRSNYFLVDIREESEIQQNTIAEVDDKMTLGAICHDASALLSRSSSGDSEKTIVFLCNTDKRAGLAAQSVMEQQSSAKVAVLQRGIVGWENMAALSPDFLVVLGLEDSTEKLSLALAAVASAVDTHDTVVLVLMSDGVNWFLKHDSPKLAQVTAQNVESVEQGAPFKPCKAMLKKFLTNGGVVLACTTCFKHRGYSLDADMMDCVNPMQMPDLIRMLGEAKGGSLQFL